MSIQQARVQGAGSTNGQWAVGARAETTTTLSRPRPAERSEAHARLRELGVGAGVLSMLAPVEAQSVLGSLPEYVTDRAAVREHAGRYLHWRDLADTGPLHELRAHRVLDEACRQYDAAVVGFIDAQAAASADGHPNTGIECEETEADLGTAVRRKDAARADLAYLTDPACRVSDPAAVERLAPGAWDQQAAIERFADPRYRGQVH
jgi:hypothetical protein